MQMKSILFIVLVGAVAVLAKKGSSSSSSSEEDRNVEPVVFYPNVDSQPMFVVAKGKRKPNRYPQGRPFQFQQQTDGQYFQMSSFNPQRPGMQEPSFGWQKPIAGSQQLPGNFDDPFNYPTMGPSGSSRPFHPGNGRPNLFPEQGRPGFGGPSQFPGQGRPGFGGPSQFPGQGRPGFGGPSQFPGQGKPGFGGPSQFPDQGRPGFGGPSQFPGQDRPGFGRPNKFPGNGRPEQFPDQGTPGYGRPDQFPDQGRPNQFPGIGGPGQWSANGQYQGGSQLPGSTQLSANGQYPGGGQFPGYDIPQVWPLRPGPGGRHHKFKGPKHHQIYIVGRPQFQQPNYYPQYQVPQYPYRPQYPENDEYPVGVSPLEVHQYLVLLQRQMQEFSARAYQEFQKVENEIDHNRKQTEESMKSQFQSLELALEAKQNKEIEQAVKEGKDEMKIQECMAEEELAFRAVMDVEIQRTVDCVNDATERSKKLLAEARNTYTESSIVSSMQAKEWAQKMKFCSEIRNFRCLEENKNLIDDRTKSTVQEGNLYFQKIQEFPQRQMIQMQYCRQNFMDDLRDMKESYSKMVKKCVIASEIQEPEEEIAKEESEKLNENAEVKPEASEA